MKTLDYNMVQQFLKTGSVISEKFESIKRVVLWRAYWYTHHKSYYPVLRQITPLNAIPRVENLKAVRKFNEGEKDLLNGKTVRQRSVRQETTIFKVGTILP